MHGFFSCPLFIDAYLFKVVTPCSQYSWRLVMPPVRIFRHATMPGRPLFWEAKPFAGRGYQPANGPPDNSTQVQPEYLQAEQPAPL